MLGDEPRHCQRRIGRKCRRDHRNAGQPPRHVPPREEELAQTLPPAPRKVEPDPKIDGEERRDHGVVGGGERHRARLRGPHPASRAGLQRTSYREESKLPVTKVTEPSHGIAGCRQADAVSEASAPVSRTGALSFLANGASVMPLALVMAAAALHLVPQPASVTVTAGCRVPAGGVLAALERVRLDEGGLQIVSERWRALGIVPRPLTLRVDLAAESAPAAPSGRYELRVDGTGILIRHKSDDGGEGVFDAYATLAQLAERAGPFRASRFATSRRCAGGSSPTTSRAGRCRRCAISKSAFARSRALR